MLPLHHVRIFTLRKMRVQCMNALKNVITQTTSPRPGRVLERPVMFAEEGLTSCTNVLARVERSGEIHFARRGEATQNGEGGENRDDEHQKGSLVDVAVPCGGCRIPQAAREGGT